MVDEEGKAGLATKNATNKSGLKDARSGESAVGMAAGTGSQILKLVYVRYKDHVYFKNYRKPPSQAMERETVGWIKEENSEVLLIVCDKSASMSKGQVNGLIILKSCILEIVDLPLQIGFEHILNSRSALLQNRVCASSRRSEKLGSIIPERSKKQ